MPADYLHNHPDFPDLIRIVAHEKGIDPALVEKDYWIMHCLYGLEQLGLKFELKGGTSLSKGFQIINRFSEDIDIRIEPPPDQNVKTGRNHDKPAHIKSRRDFYDWLANKKSASTEFSRSSAPPSSTIRTSSAAAFGCVTNQRRLRSLIYAKASCWNRVSTP